MEEKLHKDIPPGWICRSRTSKDISPRVELQKRNFVKTITPRAELQKQNFLKTFPQSEITEVELHEDICPRVELWKPNFMKTFCESVTPVSGIAEVELCNDLSP